MKYFYALTLLFFSYFLMGQNAVINEFASDPSTYDGGGGEYIELYCPAGGGNCDIGCWVVAESQGIITIPDGTIIPAGGYYLIGHGPSMSCDSCDFFGIPLDLNTATCNCLNGGSYGVGADGNPAVILGRRRNIGEMVLLYDNTGAVKETWTFDNSSGVPRVGGSLIGGTAVGACPATSIAILSKTDTALTNVGGVCLGCNTSYMRTIDGGNTWTTNNHPTPGRTNARMGDNSFDYEYRIDNGAWLTIPQNSINVDNFTTTVCSGDSVEFRVIIKNFQNITVGIFDRTGRYGSYFKSPRKGIGQWPIVTGLGAVDGEDVTIQSYKQKLVPEMPNEFTLQWAEYKNGMGSFSPTSSNECYERMKVSLYRSITIDSAVIACVDTANGLSATTVYPASLNGASHLTFTLYDDAGTQTNVVATNTSGLFSLTPADVATVGYYVVVTGACNQVTARDNGGFCKSIPACPQLTTSSFVKNAATCGQTQATIYTEDFEGALGVGYNASGVFSDGTSDYFTLIGNGANPVGLPAYTGASGTKYWAVEDNQNADNPNASGISSVTLPNIPIAGAINLSLQGLFAATDFNRIDAADYIRIFAQIDGGGFVLVGALEGTGGSNTTMAVDTDLDGTGDGTILGFNFQDITFNIPGGGTTLDIRIDVFMTAGSEEAAFDNIRVLGNVLGNCQACPGDTLTFSVAGTNLPLGGRIDWYLDTVSSFDPYNGEGSYMGFSQIPVATGCASNALVINEFVYRPSAGNGANPNAGEFIELLGPPGMDLSCYVLTDGDWVITFPSGSIIPADGLFTIGNDNVYGAGFFDLDAENCGCFIDGSGAGNGLLILTDGGEYIALFDNAATFIDGVVYGNPSAGNLPPNGSISSGGLVNTIGFAGCPPSVTIPGIASFSVASGGVALGTSLVRNPDATGAWTTQAGGSVNACNTIVPLGVVPDFDYVIPQDACNQIRYYKGVISGHPNIPSCLNTSITASTNTFEIEAQCPTASMAGDYAACATAVPITLPVTVAGLAPTAGVTFIYSKDGTPNDTLVTNLVNNVISFDVTTTGIYDGLLVVPDSGCTASVDSSIFVSVVPVPGQPILPNAMTSCEGDTALIAASGASSYQWSFDASFSVIAGVGEDFEAPAPNKVYVRTMNQNDPGTVSCLGGIDSITINTHICDVIFLAQDLLAFDAKKTDEKVQLNWLWTAINTNSYFEVERSNNAVNFKSIGTVGERTAAISTEQSYQLMDNAPQAGWNYYRLKYPKTNGFEYSQIRAVWFGEMQQPIHVYPSPTRSGLNIDFTTVLETNVSLKIVNALGQVVYTAELTEGSNNYQIDLSSLPSAIYILSISKDGLTKNIKIVKE